MSARVLETARGRRAQVEARLFELLRFPSISAQSPHRGDVCACAEWFRDHLITLGFEARLIELDGHHPIVFAQCLEAGPGKKTALCYGHLDVQPPDPLSDWITPPFQPTVRDGRIFCRGAVDDKGQLWTYVAAVEAYREAGVPLPINVKFFVECEEEVGSSGIAKALSDAKIVDLVRADVTLISDTAMPGIDHPAVTWRLRGIATVEACLFGPQADFHSGEGGGALLNPATVACHIVASCVDLASGRVLIPGFYDDLREPTAVEAEMMARYPADAVGLLAHSGAPELWSRGGVALARALWHEPTFEVNGIHFGYGGEGSKTIIPATGLLKISTRLGPGQDPDRILDLLVAHIPTLVPPAVRCEMKRGHGCWAYTADPAHPVLSIYREALGRAFETEAVFEGAGGSIPLAGLLAERLGVPTLLVGFGTQDGKLHSPNENMVLSHLHRGTEAHIIGFDLLGQ